MAGSIQTLELGGFDAFFMAVCGSQRRAKRQISCASGKISSGAGGDDDA
jgi:hypothetical protein